MTDVLIKRGNLDTERETMWRHKEEDGHVTGLKERCVKEHRGYLQPPEAREMQGEILPWRLQSVTLVTPWFQTWSFRTVRWGISVFGGRPVFGTSLGQSQETNTLHCSVAHCLSQPQHSPPLYSSLPLSIQLLCWGIVSFLFFSYLTSYSTFITQ